MSPHMEEAKLHAIGTQSCDCMASAGQSGVKYGVEYEVYVIVPNINTLIFQLSPEMSDCYMKPESVITAV